MAAQRGSAAGPVREFCAALNQLRISSGRDLLSLARELKVSRAQMYDILSGRVKRPPDWDRFVRPLVEACTGKNASEVAEWRRRHAVLVGAYEELNRQQGQQKASAADPGTAKPAGVDTTYNPIVEVRELPRFPVTRSLRVAAGTVLVLLSATGELLAIAPGEPFPPTRIDPYRKAYLIDVTQHRLHMERRLPASDGVFSFSASVSYVCQVVDPGAVVAHGWTDAAAVIEPVLARTLRDVIRRHGIEHVPAAELAANDELSREPPTGPAGFKVSGCVVRLSLDGDEAAYTRMRRSAADRLNMEAQLLAADVDDEMMLMSHLARHPLDAAAVAHLMGSQHRVLSEEQIQALRDMLESSSSDLDLYAVFRDLLPGNAGDDPLLPKDDGSLDTVQPAVDPVPGNTVEAEGSGTYYDDGWGGNSEAAAKARASRAAEAQVEAESADRLRRAAERTQALRPAAGNDISGMPPPPYSGGGEAGGPGRSPERFLVAQMPTRVPLSAEVSLLARVSVAPVVDLAAGSAPLPGLIVGPEGARVTVVVQAPHELAPLTALEQVISVPVSGDSPPVRFAFQARGLGPQRVVISAWAGGTFLAELGLELSVEQAGPYVDGPTRATPVHSVQADPGEVTLQVRSDGQRYLFQLLSPSYLFEPVLAEALTAQPSHAVERTVATLRAMAMGTGGYSGGNARTWMEQAGVGLWNDMVPELIKEQFWLVRDNIKAFSIAAADDVIPWELLYPLAQNHDDGFLVEQFPVMRRVYGQQRFRDFSAGETRYVMPSGSPRNAEGEVAAIRRILGEPNAQADAIERLDVLLALIESGRCGLLHFACHNTFTADASGSAIAMDGGPFVPLLLNKAITRQSLAEKHPLVFINACRSASTAPEYTRMMGWAQGFMAAGAGAFAGTLWAVRTESAATFAETFYSELSAGRTLGDACRQARTECGRDHDDPTWLAYSVYGDPAATATLASQE
jgi:hypothetical protein